MRATRDLARLSPPHIVWRRRVFASTWLCYAGMYFCRKPFYITKSALGDSLGMSASTLGTIGAVYLVCYTCGQFLSGYFGNRLGQRITLLSGMGLSVVSNVVFGTANSTAAFLVFMAVNGLAQSCGWSGNVGVMANWFRREERGTVMGFWATNFQIGGMLANALAAWALGAYGFRYSYFFGTAVLIAVWVFFYFNERDRPEDLGLPPIALDAADAARAAASPQAGPNDRAGGTGWTRAVFTNVLLLGAFYFFLKFIRYALWSWAPFILSRNFALSGSDAGYLSTVFDACGFVGVIAIGYLSDRFFASRRAGISLIIVLAMVAATMALYVFGRFSVPAFTVCIGMIGLTLYGPDSLLSGAAAMDVGSRRGATLAAGIINGMGSVGTVFQELIIGRMYDSGGGSLGPILVVLFGASGLAALALVVIVVRNRLGISDV